MKIKKFFNFSMKLCVCLSIYLSFASVAFLFGIDAEPAAQKTEVTLSKLDEEMLNKKGIQVGFDKGMATATVGAEKNKEQCHCSNCKCVSHSHCGCFSEKGCHCASGENDPY